MWSLLRVPYVGLRCSLVIHQCCFIRSSHIWLLERSEKWLYRRKVKVVPLQPRVLRAENDRVHYRPCIFISLFFLFHFFFFLVTLLRLFTSHYVQCLLKPCNALGIASNQHLFTSRYYAFVSPFIRVIILSFVLYNTFVIHLFRLLNPLYYPFVSCYYALHVRHYGVGVMTW